ncbi:unnamed protein product [Adineta ricciae]|uniref:PDZ domain-containing protein n=1 Tax=Adineta ricciae TaxID=249248 RepID=A0A816C1A2_ADIRI|nr:unnamed protein product [Adineta ricciae]
MSKVFISRPDGTVSWGFRLQGGLEYNEPLTVTNIVPESPADGKLDPGDMITEIAGNNVTNMTHRDALDLIQRCANALFLTVHKVGYAYPPGGSQPRPAPVQSMWKPGGPPQSQPQPQQYQQQYPQHQPQSQPPPSSAYYQQDFQQQPPYYQQNYQQQPPYYQPSFQQQQQQPSYYQHDAHYQQQPPYYQQQSQYQQDFYHQPPQYNYGQPQQPMFNAAPPTAAPSETATIPAALAKSLGRPGGPKPFTYTPGGLDLSKIRESARVRRHREYISNSEEPNDTQDIEPTMNRRMVSPAEQYTPQNSSHAFNQSRQQPTQQKKHIQHDTDVVTQSRSFQMLQGWISDSEKTVPTAVPPPSQSHSQPQSSSPSSSATATTSVAATAAATAAAAKSAGLSLTFFFDYHR